MVVVGLGIMVAWAGYAVMLYGQNLYRGWGLQIGDLVLPSHRGKYIAATKQVQLLQGGSSYKIVNVPPGATTG